MDGPTLILKLRASDEHAATITLRAKGDDYPDIPDDVELPTFIDREHSKVPIVNDVDDAYEKGPIVLYIGDEAPAILLLEETTYWIRMNTGGSVPLPFLNNNKDFNLNPSLLDEDQLERTFVLEFHDYVGRGYFDAAWGDDCAECPFEVRSKKMGYFKDYKKMLQDIAEYSIDLVLNPSGYLYQPFEIDTCVDESPYQMYLALEYIFRRGRFRDQFRSIKSNPYTQLIGWDEQVPAGCAHNISPDSLPDILAPWNLEPIKGGAIMGSYSPLTVKCRRDKITMDTQENRFVKFFVESLDALSARLEHKTSLMKERLIRDRLKEIRSTIDEILSDPWFNNISKMDIVPVQSTVLRMRRGYRDFFRFHLLLGYSVRLNTDLMSNALEGHTGRLSQMYEDWCYIQLVRSLTRISIDGQGHACQDCNNSKFRLKPYWFDVDVHLNDMSDSAPKSTPQKLDIRSKSMKLTVELHHHKKYMHDPKQKEFSSVSIDDCTPDYTMIIRDEKMRTCMINLDAKYRIETKGQVKNDDLFTMHAYHDCIRLSCGAVVLFPGEKESWYTYEYPGTSNWDTKYYTVPAVGAISMKPFDFDGTTLDKALRKILISTQISTGVFKLEPETDYVDS